MNRLVLVTGGSRGIGAAIVRTFTDAGAEVLAPSHEELNLASPESVSAFAARGAANPVDVLVNNAGVNHVASFDELDLRRWSEILTVNLTSAFLLTKAFAPGMASRGWGRIVNVSSIYGLLARPGRAAYSASKAGLNALTRTAALEYGPRGVLVNALCPGFVDTEMTRRNNDPEKIRELAAQTALGRLAAPEEIARAVLFLGSEENTYVTGHLLVIDGGFSCQ